MSGGPAETGHARLSRRELEVARLVAEGLTNREISARLFVSERTIDGHLEHVREKLGVNSRAQVAAWVVRQEHGAVAAAPPPAAVVRRPGRGATGRLRFWLAAAVTFALLAAGVIGLLREPPAPRILTIAGTEPIDAFNNTFSGDGSPATSAELDRPSSVASGPAGVVYIADYGNQRVRIVGTDGTIRTVAGGGDQPLSEGTLATAVSIAFPSTVAVDRGNRLYILTNQGGALEVWSVGHDTLVHHELSLPPTGYQPAAVWADPVGGLAVANDGSLYIADSAGNRVWSFHPGRDPALLAGSGDAGFSGDNGPATTAALDSPVGLALDEKRGYLYVADVGNDRIRRINLQSRIISTFAGSGDTYGDSGDGGPATSARLKIPCGVAVASDGTVYIADTGNSRIRKVTPSGVIVAVAGIGIGGFFGDGGPAIGAQLNGPEAVALEPNGNLLVADTFNHRVRKVLTSR